MLKHFCNLLGLFKDGFSVFGIYAHSIFVRCVRVFVRGGMWGYGRYLGVLLIQTIQIQMIGMVWIWTIKLVRIWLLRIRSVRFNDADLDDAGVLD